MKRMIISLFCLLTLIVSAFPSYAYDFQAKNSDGVTIFYNNLSSGTCEVTNESMMSKSYKNTVNIPEKVDGKLVTGIGDWAFSGCKELTSVSIPASVLNIGGKAFDGCTNLTSITMPESLICIEGYAFRDCSALASIYLPESLNSIGGSAFSGCSSLTSITVPKSLSQIEKNVFKGCDNLKEICNYSKLDMTDYRLGVPNSAKVVQGSALNNYAAQPVQSSQPSQPTQAQPVKAQVSKDELPLIAVVQNSIKFGDADGTNAIDAGEKCFIEFNVVNKGKGVASNCVAKCKFAGASAGLSSTAKTLDDIAPGGSLRVRIPIEASRNITSGKVEITVEISEPHGLDAEPFMLACETHPFMPPHVLMADYAITSAGGSVLSKKEPFKLQMLVQNASTGGKAENVGYELVLPDNVLLVEGTASSNFGTLGPGESRMVECELLVNSRYEGNEIPISLKLKESTGNHSENGTIKLQLSQQMAATRLDIKSTKKDYAQNPADLASIAGGRKQSDIDKDIPSTSAQREKTFAVIIANENYRYETGVPYAAADGMSTAQYLHQALGIPEKNIKVFADATLNDMRQGLGWLGDIDKAYKGEASMILYYAGHGIPDEETHSAYLVPADGSGKIINTCMPLQEVSQALGKMQASSVLVMLDACFSGSVRGDQMLASSARSVSIKPKTEALTGNVVMLSATQDDQTAWPYESQGHGMFTYYILKKLQETRGNVTLGELFDYVSTKVSQSSIIENGKLQNPSSLASPKVQKAWTSWKF